MRDLECVGGSVCLCVCNCVSVLISLAGGHFVNVLFRGATLHWLRLSIQVRFTCQRLESMMILDASAISSIKFFNY